MTQAQLAWYRAMEEAGEMVPLRTRAELEAHLALWQSTAPLPSDPSPPSATSSSSFSSPPPAAPTTAARPRGARGRFTL
jgi:hypothetical protein